MTEDSLDRLYRQVVSRKNADPQVSYTARLYRDGVAKCAKKLGEEGVEAALAGALGDRKGLVSESADLLYHLTVVWAIVGVTPDEVYAELKARENNSGPDAKASRRGT
jgi:phosphoribosyl-ATP pyrophosphohydrolase